MKCFYHNADLDGKCSAAIVWYVYPEIELIGINYGDPFPWDSLRSEEVVYMVDFSLQPFNEMIKLANFVNLVWIDHHKTAIEEMLMLKSEHYLSGIQRVGIGACSLVWEWFYNKVIKLPLLGPDFSYRKNPGVQLLAEYDVWNHSDPKCLPFQYGMCELDNEPSSDVWRRVLNNDSAFIAEVVKRGELILKYEARQNKERVKALSFEAELDGLKVIAANHGLGNSKLFDSVWDPDKHDAMLTFVWRGGQWTVSLYTDKDGVDVGAVAKARGGGGHVKAAGFQCKELPLGLIKQ